MDKIGAYNMLEAAISVATNDSVYAYGMNRKTLCDLQRSLMSFQNTSPLPPGTLGQLMGLPIVLNDSFEDGVWPLGHVCHA